MMAIIGGTGFGSLLQLTNPSSSQVDTQYGCAHIQKGTLSGKPIIFLPRHGNPPRIPPHLINYRANIKALWDNGVTNILALNAVGSVDKFIKVPSLIVPNQIIDYTNGREHTFFDDKISHIEFTNPFDDELRQKLIEGAQGSLSLKRSGVYGCTQGPRLETAAEVRRLRKDGCDVVGMTLMPEAALARELEMAYASVCVVVNEGAGIRDDLIKFDLIKQAIEASSLSVMEAISNVLTSTSLPKEELDTRN